MESYHILLMGLVFGGIAIMCLSDISMIIRNKLHWYKEANGKYYFAIHFVQILTRIDDYEAAFYQYPKPKYRIFQLYSLIIIPLCIAFLIAYNIFIAISIFIWIGYGYCYIKFYKIWKLYGCSKLMFWMIAISLFLSSFYAAPNIRMAFIIFVDTMISR